MRFVSVDISFRSKLMCQYEISLWKLMIPKSSLSLLYAFKLWTEFIDFIYYTQHWSDRISAIVLRFFIHLKQLIYSKQTNYFNSAPSAHFMQSKHFHIIPILTNCKRLALPKKSISSQLIKQVFLRWLKMHSGKLFFISINIFFGKQTE